ncbi:dimethyl sulfoxide reductase anchor subunit family protein [Lysobacter koreensis]|uniref:Dimethyl sulfoxide reductase anchor subunit family protein n=1 Tax=Lysobacter koreensis TaxID=266122 RepID=A0ABW2YMC4_9GAMM
MNPAFSVIWFTTLSGAGYGLLAAIAMSVLVGGQPARALLLLWLLAMAMITVGLLSSLAHLGKPLRAWRALSQWRTSWLSREGVASLLTYLPALALGALLLPNLIAANADTPAVRGNAWGIAACILAIVGAGATVVCTAMIYASLKPIPAWRHRLVLPAYVVFALLTGVALLAAGLALAGADARAVAGVLAIAAIAAGATKWRYWRAIDALALPATRGDAVGLPGRQISVFERPHTQDNYLTREMGFVVARKHARRLRVIAVVLFGAVPALAALIAWVIPASAPVVLPLASLSALLGAVVERWLFFAQARHLVTLYY